jgi:chromosome segregation ATPase
LGSQINTILRLGPEEQRQLVALMWQTIEEMETALIRVQDAHRRLQRTLREKRLLLTDRKEELRRVLEREAAQLETIATLRQDNARLTRENGALQRQLARQQEDFGGLQRQYATLSQQHDELVGKYHNLFQDFTREQRKAGR